MESKTIVKIKDSKILAIVSSNDPSLVISDADYVIDITNNGDREKIVADKGKYFKIKNKKIVEMSDQEKADIDEVTKPPKDSKADILEQILDKLTKLENRVKKLEK